MPVSANRPERRLLSYRETADTGDPYAPPAIFALASVAPNTRPSYDAPGNYLARPGDAGQPHLTSGGHAELPVAAMPSFPVAVGAAFASYRPGVARGSRPVKAARRSQSSAPGAGETSAPKGTPGPIRLR